MKGIFKIFKNGELIRTGTNTVMTLGKNLLLDNWRGRTNVTGVGSNIGYIAIGTSGVAPSVGQLDLGSEIDDGRQAVSTSARPVTGSTITVSAIFPSGAAASVAVGSIEEVGLFGTGYQADESTLDTASASKDSGIMFCRATFGTIVKASGDQLLMSWDYSLW